MAINEGSTCILTLAFKDEDGLAVTPDAATYRIDDIRSKTAIVAETAISPLGTTADIIITATQNAIINTNVAVENHIVTIEFDYDTSTKSGTGRYVLEISNLKFVT